MIELIARALEAAGYDGLAPTAEHLVQCFHDYVDAGAWHNVHLVDGVAETDNGEEVTSLKAMAKALLRLR